MANLKDSSYLKSPLALLILLMPIYVVLWAMYPQELDTGDPVTYASRAKFLSSHTAEFLHEGQANSIFDQRLAVTVPVAVLYKLFGINNYTTNVWPLVATLLTFIGVYAVLPTAMSNVFGVLFCFCNVMTFRHAGLLYPDIICSASMFLATIFLFYRQRASKGGLAGLCYPLFAMTFLFVAFLAKENVFWVLPIWIYALASDLRNKEYGLLKRFYAPAIVTGLLLGILYLLFCQTVWNDPFARFKTVESIATQHQWSLENASRARWIGRLTTGPLRMFRVECGLFAVFTAFGLWFVPKSHRLWSYYTLCMLLFFWFGSVSFTIYQPMPLWPRMAVPLLPGMLIVAALFADYLCSLPTYSLRSRRWIAVAIVVLAVFPFGKFLMSWSTSELAESHAMNLFKSEVLSHPQEKILLLCSDERSPRSLEFYFYLEYPKNLQVLHIEKFLQDPKQDYDEVYIFTNHRRAEFLQRAYGHVHFEEQIEALRLPPLFAEGTVELFHPESSLPLRDRLTKADSQPHK